MFHVSCICTWAELDFYRIWFLFISIMPAPTGWTRGEWMLDTGQFYKIIQYIISYMYISVYLDDILQGEWNIHVTSKLFEVQPIIKRSFTPMERRRDDVVLCRARIGHAYMYFTNGYLLRGELRPMCYNTRLAVRHVLLSCAKYAHIRRRYLAFNSLFELFRDTPAGFNIQFLRECNLYSMF